MSDITINTPTDELIGKFEQLEATLGLEIVERRAEIAAMTRSIIAGTSMFLLGPPGVAKSMLINRALVYILGGEAYEILMTRFTQPEEVFGPQSLVGLKNDEFKRKRAGYLSMADIAFVDEIFKANSSILNALLWAVNERKYRHDDSIITIPLHTLFCASNELPQDDSLKALYDRLLTRMVVSPIRDTQSFITMLKTELPVNPQPILTWDEVMQASDEADKVILPDDVIEAMAEIKVKLAHPDIGIEPSARRFIQGRRLVRAEAWLDGCDTAEVEHLRPLVNVLWEIPEQHAIVTDTILAIAAPLDNAAVTLLGDVEKLEEQLRKLTGEPNKNQAAGVEIYKKLRSCTTELTDLEAKAKSGNARKRSSSTMDEVRARLMSATKTVMHDLFELDVDTLPTGDLPPTV